MQTTLDFALVANWEKLPAGVVHADVSDVAIDSADRVYLLTRADSQVLVYEPDGTFVRAWGKGEFILAHGIKIGPDGDVYCVDCGTHTVRRYSPEGVLRQTIGRPGVASDTGYDPTAPWTVNAVENVRYPGPPFNACTNVAIASNGDLFVSDGYGNCRVQHLDVDGNLLASWGEVGSGPGQFRLPHCIALDPQGRVLVGDRENDRIQIFTADGAYLTEWNNLLRPSGLAVDSIGRVYVAELWRPVGRSSFVSGVATVDQPGRVSVFDPDGTLLARWGESTERRGAAGNFIAPHGIAVDSTGAVYVTEVTGSYAVKPGLIDPIHADHQLQKFIPL